MVGGQQRLEAFGGWRRKAAVAVGISGQPPAAAVATATTQVPIDLTEEADVSTHHTHLLHYLPLSPWSTSQTCSSLPLFLSPRDPSPRHLLLTIPFNIPRMRNLRPCACPCLYISCAHSCPPCSTSRPRSPIPHAPFSLLPSPLCQIGYTAYSTTPCMMHIA